MQRVFEMKAPKRKQQPLIPEHKRVKRRPRAQSEDSEEVGKKIEPTKNYIPGTVPGIPPIKKEEWKYFKPWIEEETLPKWAADLKEAPLQHVLTH